MSIDGTLLDETLKNLLQKNLRLSFKNKPFKLGKLLLYHQNNYFLSLLFHNHKKGNVKFEIPIPYCIESWPDEDVIYFDYRLSALSKKKDNLLKLLREIKCTKETKFYDSIMEITILANTEII